MRVVIVRLRTAAVRLPFHANLSKDPCFHFLKAGIPV